MKPVKVSVKRREIDPEPVGIIAQAILDIDKGMKALNSTRLSRAAIVVLLQNKTSLGRGAIYCVLEHLDTLAKDWLKPL